MQWAMIPQLHVCSFINPGANLARDEPTSQSSTLDSGSESSNAVDDDPASCSRTQAEQEPWLILDLGSVVDIERIVLTNPDPSWNGYL